MEKSAIDFTAPGSPLLIALFFRVLIDQLFHLLLCVVQGHGYIAVCWFVML